MGHGGIAPRILNLALVVHEWSASRLGRFTLGEWGRVPGIQRWRLGGPQSRSECGGEEKNNITLQRFEPRSSIL
jgi:hypothetical protein